MNLRASTLSHADPARKFDLKSQTRDLLSWLKQGPSGVDHGWEVLNLMLKNSGNIEWTANAMCIHTGTPWTIERTRSVVRRIQNTPKGQALCEAAGLKVKGESNKE